LLVAFVSLALFPEIRQMGLVEPVAGQTGPKPDVGFAWVIREVSPHGLRGLILVTFFAAFMSTISTQMNWGASYLVCDVYQRFLVKQPSQQHLTRVSRAISLFVLLTGGVAAYLMRHLSVDDAWKMLVALGAGTGAVFMLRWFWWRINAWTEITAMCASLVYYNLVTSCVSLLAKRQAQGLIEPGSWQAAWLTEGNRVEVQTLVVACLTIVTWLAVTFLTPAEDPRVLEAFYRKVRPGGPGWKPIARRAPDVEVDRHLRISILASLLGAAMIYLTLPAMGWLLFGQYRQAAWGLGGAAACGAAIYVLLKRIGWAKIVA
jgi:Na+/proline symporter